MRFWLTRHGSLLAVLVLFLICTGGCASWRQLPPAQPIEPYRGLNENTIIR